MTVLTQFVTRCSFVVRGYWQHGAVANLIIDDKFIAILSQIIAGPVGGGEKEKPVGRLFAATAHGEDPFVRISAGDDTKILHMHYVANSTKH